MFPPCRLSSSLLKAAREESPEEGAGAAPGLGLSCTSRVPGPGLGWHHQQGGDGAQPGRDSGESAQRFCILSLTHLPAKRQKCRILHPVAADKLQWGGHTRLPFPSITAQLGGHTDSSPKHGQTNKCSDHRPASAEAAPQGLAAH